jgi:hypothetical protein
VERQKQLQNIANNFKTARSKEMKEKSNNKEGAPT